MRKKSLIKIIMIVALASVLLFQTVGCSKGEEECPVSLPDYSATNYQFDFEAALNTSYFYKNGELIEDPEMDFYNNVEAIKTIKEMGNTIAKISRDTAAVELTVTTQDDWNNCYTKKMGDLLYENGIKKVYISDKAFLKYNFASPKLLDEYTGDFKTVEKLDEFVTERLSIYINEPWLYGIDIVDEPNGKSASNISTMISAIHRCSKALGKELNTNLNLLCTNSELANITGNEKYDTKQETYVKYLESYVENSNIDGLAVDHYPFKADGVHLSGYFASLQKLRDVCTKYDIDMGFYAQSFGYIKKNNVDYRCLDQSELNYVINSIIGFGTKIIQWYRYVPLLNYNYARLDGVSDGFTVDHGCLVDRYGKPTNLYYYAKELVEQYQSFANIFFNYKYQGAKLYQNSTLSQFDIGSLFNNALESGDKNSIRWNNEHTLKLVKDVKMSNEAMLFTEFYDETNKLYMYMAMNPIDPGYSNVADTTQNIEVNFGEEYEWAAVYEQGNINYVKLDQGVYKKTLSAGYCSYIIPLKTK